MVLLLLGFWVPLTVVLPAVAIRLFEDKPAALKVIAALAVALNAILVPLFTFTPQTPVTNVVVFFLLGWLASFKVLGKAFGRGPLCFSGLTMLGTLTTYALPINPVSKAKTNASSASSASSTLAYAWGAALHVLLLIFCTSLSHRLQQVPYGPTGYAHMLLSDLVDAFNLYAFIAIIMNVASIGTAWAGKSLLGFSEIAPQCDRPYVLTTSTDVRPDALTYLSPSHLPSTLSLSRWLATSFSEFWSRWVLEELDRHALARPDSHSLPLAPTRFACSFARQALERQHWPDAQVPRLRSSDRGIHGAE